MAIKPEIEFKDPRPGEIGNFVADTTLLQSKFNHIPNTDIETGIKETVDWLKTS